jgi:hypothetical protein
VGGLNFNRPEHLEVKIPSLISFPKKCLTLSQLVDRIMKLQTEDIDWHLSLSETVTLLQIISHTYLFNHGISTPIYKLYTWSWDLQMRCKSCESFFIVSLLSLKVFCRFAIFPLSLSLFFFFFGGLMIEGECRVSQDMP